MDCEAIKSIIPRYFQHNATDDEVKQVEEHLCVCHDCRTALGELMDETSQQGEPASLEIPQEVQEPASEEPQMLPEKPQKPEDKEEIQETSPSEEKIEYFPGEGLDEAISLPEKPSIQEKPLEPQEEPLEEAKEELPQEEPQMPPEQPQAFSSEPLDEESVPVFEEEKPLEPPAQPEPKEEEPKEVPQEELLEPQETIPSDDIEKPAALSAQQEAFSEEESTYPLDDQLIGKDKAGAFEYIALLIGVSVFLFIIYLLIKG